MVVLWGSRWLFLNLLFGLAAWFCLIDRRDSRFSVLRCETRRRVFAGEIISTFLLLLAGGCSSLSTSIPVIVLFNNSSDASQSDVIQGASPAKTDMRLVQMPSLFCLLPSCVALDSKGGCWCAINKILQDLLRQRWPILRYVIKQGFQICLSSLELWWGSPWGGDIWTVFHHPWNSWALSFVGWDTSSMIYRRWHFWW